MCFQKNNIWNRIEQYKPVFVEPRNKHEFHTAMENFYEKINDPAQNGAVFAAVCRGKVQLESQKIIVNACFSLLWAQAKTSTPKTDF